MSTFLTTLNGKKCTATPRVKNVGGGATTTAAASSSSFSPSSTLSSTSIASTSTPISTSTSTTFSTSISSTSIPPTIPSTTTSPAGFINAPAPDTSTSAAQETLTSTTSFTSSQSVIPISNSISSAIETDAPSIPSSIPPSTPALETESPTTPSTTFSLDSTTISTPQSTDQGLGLTTQTNDSLASTITSITSDASSGASSFTSAVTGGIIATTTTTGSEQLESSNSGAGLTNGAQNNVTGSAISTQTTVAVAGGVIGGLALISIIAFLLWFWRKRLMKKRRSTLLTPLSAGQANGGGEKGPYIISRNSLGPTTIPEKVRAVVSYNYQRLRGRVNSLVTRSPRPSVDLNRGNSQFGGPGSPESRSAGVDTDRSMTTKGRFVDWWGRLTEDGSLNWKLRNDPKGGRPNNDTYTSMSNVAQPRKKGSQPDFLTLLSMDEKQQQGTSNNTAAGSSNPRRSQSLGNDHFLGGLGLNFDIENPFADSNAMSHDSAKVKPLAVSGPETSNPFSDANALPGLARPANGGGPATYVQNIRRSRGHSVSAANTRPPSSTRMPSMYRESRVSVETSDTRDTRRNKFRSDPFDLDRPELLAQSPGSRPGSRPGSSTRSGYNNSNGRVGLPSAPRPAHARNESFTSKYSSGVSSMGEWSDPGPDVGPGARRWDTPSPEGALGRLGTGSERNRGGESQRSVGKAM